MVKFSKNKKLKKKITGNAEARKHQQRAPDQGVCFKNVGTFEKNQILFGKKQVFVFQK